MEFPIFEVVWVAFIFIIGAAMGSFLNVVVGRLPLEKSILWPNSRCLSCLHSLEFNDNLPVLGWLLRRGRCRYCGSQFSSRYMWVELAMGVGFGLLFYLDVIVNWHGVPYLETARLELDASGLPPWRALPFFLHHAILFSLLLAAALCDWDHRSIPLTLTVFGTVIGLISATCWPWPWPNDPGLVAKLNEPMLVNGQLQERNWAFDLKPGELIFGLYPWPVWGPLPSWLASHRWLLGFLTGMTGAAAGMALVRSVKFMFERGLGREAMGLGDADVLMMAGAFLGWQIAVVSFFVGAIVSLPIGIVFRLVKKERAFPFGPGLALGVMITTMTWRTVGPIMQLYLFEEILVLVAIVVMGAGLFVGSVIVRILGLGKQ